MNNASLFTRYPYLVVTVISFLRCRRVLKLYATKCYKKVHILLSIHVFCFRTWSKLLLCSL